MKRTLLLAGITALLLIGGVIGCIFVMQKDRGAVAVITQNGTTLHRIDLSDVQESYTITLDDGDGGENVILVEPGRISMQHADCPDGLCMKMPPLPEGGLPIVCLPHHVIIEMEEAASDGWDAQVY